MFVGLCAVKVWAGGSGLNVAVVVNQNSTNSVQLGTYYCEERQVPPQNLMRASWPGGNITWMESDLTSVILNPLLSMLSSRQLTNQIDYVVLCMDFPYRVGNNGLPTVAGTNGTTSMLFYGFHADGAPQPGLPASCNLPNSTSNSYAGSEGIFRSTPPASGLSSSFLTAIITYSNLAAAEAIIDQGVASDFTFPTQTVYLAKSTDEARNIRYVLFDNTVFDTRLRGNYSVQRTNTYTPSYLGYILGYQNGVQIIPIAPNIFVPGALADQLTSYGGQLYEQTDHTTALAFMNAGAAGSYGTVIEPCGYLEKFPSSQNYFYQSRGFTMAECYYQSVTNPYQGVLVGEPLAAPFAQPPAGAWSNLPDNAILSGTTNLSVQCVASDAQHPVQQVDLFLDGTWLQTITNIAPHQNNTLNVTLNGRSMTYTVPASATIKSVTAGLTSLLNTTANTNATKVAAFAHGDRIELRSFDITKAGSQVPLAVSNAIGSASALTTFLNPSGNSFLDTVAQGIQSYVLSANPIAGDFLFLAITKTNGIQVQLGVTNSSGSMTLGQMTQQLLDTVNTNTSLNLQGPDGLTSEDLISYPVTPQQVQFNLLANSPGWQAAQIQVNLTASLDFMMQPVGVQHLDENLPDLEPRNHLYITAGATNIPLTFPFNTAALANGFHELSAVIYEGSHVRTQARIAKNVQIQNGPLSATFTTLFGGSNTLLSATLQFSVVANTNNISKIELFSTGGSLASVTNQPNALFSILGTNLDLGLHPFYAIVTAATGKQYRTDTKWVRLVTSPDAPFALSIRTPPPTLSWPATVGRTYNILSTTNLANPFSVFGSLAPSNSSATWTDTSTLAPKRFYRIQTTN
jgi:uncharacterized protein (TIGR03790 family)